MSKLVAMAVVAAALAVSAAEPASADRQCPPGLAKKSPACVPPGHAARHAKHGPREHHDYLRGDYVMVRNPYRYQLPPLEAGEQYYRMGNRILRVDDGTKQILDVIALGAEFLD